jgi:MoxR-like ATPase
VLYIESDHSHQSRNAHEPVLAPALAELLGLDLLEIQGKSLTLDVQVFGRDRPRAQGDGRGVCSDFSTQRFMISCTATPFEARKTCLFETCHPSFLNN